MQENLWVHTLGPLNAQIQSKAVLEVSKSKLDSETSKTASDWIGMLKGSNVTAPSGSLVLRLHVFARLFASCSFLHEKTSGFPGNLNKPV